VRKYQYQQGRIISKPFAVEVRDGNIVVTFQGFRAIYYKPIGQTQLILRERSKTDDHELISGAWQAANEKARELGWIV
jgi:hypothetical protein